MPQAAGPPCPCTHWFLINGYLDLGHRNHRCERTTRAALPPLGGTPGRVSATTVASLDSRVLGPPIRVQRSLPFSREPSSGHGSPLWDGRHASFPQIQGIRLCRVARYVSRHDPCCLGRLSPNGGPLSVSIARKRTRYDPCNASVRLSAVVVLWRRTVWTCPKAGRTGGLIRKKNTDVAAVGGGSPPTLL